MRESRAPTLRLSLQQPDPRHRTLLTRAFVGRCLRAALNVPAEITVRIVDESEGRALNHGYRGRGYATNVLTFDYAQEPEVEADLVLCAPVVEREAQQQSRELEHHYAHLLVHGALHAQGWDHEDAAEAADMEALETLILASLGVDDPYRRTPADQPRRSRRATSRAK